MRKRKLRRQLEAAYGHPPDADLLQGDLDDIRTYHDYRLRNNLDPFSIDDTTWRDLSMDDLFRRVNTTHSTSGEQTLYHLLRCPAVDRKTYDERRALIEKMERFPDLRLALMMILWRLGKRFAANTRNAFSPTDAPDRWLRLAPLLVSLLLLSIAGLFFTNLCIVPVFMFLLACPIYRVWMLNRLSGDIATAAYSVGLVAAARKIEKTRGGELRDELSPMFDAARRALPVLGVGSVSYVADSDIAMLFNTIFLIDILSHKRLKKLLTRHRDDIFLLHEHIGRLDAAIAVASFRKSKPGFCAPEIDFADGAPTRISMRGLVHPLIEKPVPNDLDAAEPMLVTGSNASGKSTFLKAVALNALLAQSICTAPCEAYRAASFRIYTSMAITDSVIGGESYFIAEIKSVKRIVDATARGERLLCAIDEVLRGTNTIERVAASSALLAALCRPNALCFGATHDMELCALLRDQYRLAHFEEQVREGDVSFDYRLREGPATTRNALKLLKAMGFDEELVARATERAERFEKTGGWG